MRAQDDGVNDPDGIDTVEIDAMEEPQVLRLQALMMVRVGVGDADAAGRHAVETTLV